MNIDLKKCCFDYYKYYRNNNFIYAICIKKSVKINYLKTDDCNIECMQGTINVSTSCYVSEKILNIRSMT